MRLFMTRLLDAKENRIPTSKFQFAEYMVAVNTHLGTVIAGTPDENDGYLVMDAMLTSSRLEMLRDGWMLFSGFERNDKARRCWQRQEWLLASPDIMIDDPDSVEPKPDAPFPSEVT